MASSSGLTERLSRARPAIFSAYAIAAAFATYFCMYAFRKPFTAAHYAGSAHLPGLTPVDLKILYVVAQLVGYAASKFLGIKFVSEMPHPRRALALVGFIGVAEAALVLFAVLPRPWGAVALVFNGLPLGMIWGLVFSFLEGRLTSDLLGAGLCASFVVASGFVKTAGELILRLGVSEYWMPAVTGAVFLPALMGFTWLLSKLPEPSAADVAERTRRAPMDARARWAFFARFAPGLVLLIVGYVVLTAFRDFRDNFAPELWDALGYARSPEIFTTAELPVAFGSLIAVALIVLVHDSRRALAVIHAMMVAGAVLTGVSTLLYQAGALPPAAWMISTGLGLYVAYVPFNCVLFDRMIAAVGSVATAGFLIYVADSLGYAGSVALNLYKNFGEPQVSWLSFFVGFSHVTAVGMGLCFALSGVWFWRHTGRNLGVEVEPA